MAETECAVSSMARAMDEQGAIKCRVAIFLLEILTIYFMTTRSIFLIEKCKVKRIV